MNWKRLARDKRAQAAIVGIIVTLAGSAGLQCNPDQQQLMLDVAGAIADAAVTDTTE